MYTFDVWQDPYDACFNTCSKKQLTLEPGLTVLVGCNGAGKTTLIQNISSASKDDKIPCYFYDNLKDAPDLGQYIYNGEYELGALAFSSSEGENITINISRIKSYLEAFIDEGLTPSLQEKRKWGRILSGDRYKEDEYVDNRRIILMDAVDSGYSIDNVVMLKNMIHEAERYAKSKGKELYVIAAANEYELASGERCLDVTNGEALTFGGYEDYRNFIIASRLKKDKRIESQTKKLEARKAREEKKVLKQNETIGKVVASYCKQHKIDNLSKLKSYDYYRISDKLYIKGIEVDSHDVEKRIANGTVIVPDMELKASEPEQDAKPDAQEQDDQSGGTKISMTYTVPEPLTSDNDPVMPEPEDDRPSGGMRIISNYRSFGLNYDDRGI